MAALEANFSTDSIYGMQTSPKDRGPPFATPAPRTIDEAKTRAQSYCNFPVFFYFSFFFFSFFFFFFLLFFLFFFFFFFFFCFSHADRSGRIFGFRRCRAGPVTRFEAIGYLQDLCLGVDVSNPFPLRKDCVLGSVALHCAQAATNRLKQWFGIHDLAVGVAPG